MAFIHLHLHTEYSLIDGLININRLASKASLLEMPAIAVTECSNAFSAIKFYQAMLQHGIKPIIGAECRVVNDHHDKFDLVLLCQHHDGFRTLSRLISRSYTDGQIRGVPHLHYDWIKHDNEGLIALSAAEQGQIGIALANQDKDRVESLLEAWSGLFPNRFYIELQRIGNRQQPHYIQNAIRLADQFQIPVVATNNVRFLNRDDFEAHEARVCIHQGYTLNDPRRPRLYTDQQYLRSDAEMQALFFDIPEAITNTVKIAQRCSVEFSLGEHFLPHFTVAPNETQDDRLRADAERGLSTILAELDSSADNLHKVYQERLDREIEVITGMGFPGYFLIVADFIRWAKENAIPVGPGRGSGAGSLVAYALGITELDPIEYDLLFERFLNPERVSLPDFDIDFCMARRDEVIDYVAEHYGRDHVSQIITYGTMAAKAVIRDVGRVLGFPYGFVDQIAKLIPFDLNMTLDRALDEEKALRQRYQSEDDVQALIDLAKKLEGISRNAGRHAGGVVIAPGPLFDYMPLYCEQDSQATVTQFDMGDVESIGLVKFDFLGLRTLTIIDRALRDINRLRRQQQQDIIDIRKIPQDDRQTYELIQRMDTTAIFQLESDGMKKLVKRLKPDVFDDLIALVALFRPGPLQSGMVDDFIDRKHGRARVRYMHDDLESVLKPTYGVILYQEQVMQIAQILSGYSLGAADLLRRAMGKKKPEEMVKQREIFTRGAVARGVPELQAAMIFDLMEKFAGYGFNKSHSAAYALIAYQTAWLKTHYPAAFMAAVLSSDMDNTDKVVTLLEETRRMGITLQPPSVNYSFYRFTVIDVNAICYGLGAIKGVGATAIDNIVSERTENGAYSDLFNLCKRLDLRKVNRRVLDSLIRSGSMDDLGQQVRVAGRSSLVHNLDKAISLAEQHTRNHSSGQDDMFGLDATPGDQIHTETASLYDAVTDWTEKERLAGEKDTLGFYLKGHPINRYEQELERLLTSRLHAVKLGSVIIAGYILSIRTRTGSRGQLAEIRLDDRTARVLVSIYSDEYQRYRHLLVKDQLVIIKGRAIQDDYIESGLSVRANQVFSLDELRNQCASLHLIMSHDQMLNGQLESLKKILQPFSHGHSDVYLRYDNGEARVNMRLGHDWRLSLTDELIDKLYESIGKDSVRIDYSA